MIYLESSLAKSTSGEANLRSHVCVLQRSLAATCVDLIASQSSIATATAELNRLRADNQRLTSQVSDLTSIAESFGRQHSLSKASISPAAFDSSCGERDRY